MNKIDAVLGVIHGLNFISTSLLLGSLVFQTFILPRSISLGPDDPPWRSRQTKLFIVLTFLFTSLWLILSVVNMTDSWNFPNLMAGIWQTLFGRIWFADLIFLAVIYFAVQRRNDAKSNPLVLTFILFFLPLSSVLTGHAASSEFSNTLKMLVDWIHAIAVSVWTGGLWCLYEWLDPRTSGLSKNNFQTLMVVRRFSHAAILSTFLITISGLLMSYWYGVVLLKPWTNGPYGKLLLAKVILFSLALMAASINQFVHLKNAESKDQRSFALSIRREVRLEMILIAFAFIVAGFLTRADHPGM